MSVKQSERTLSNFLAYLDGLRERGAVHFDDKIKAWHVLDYHDTLQVLTDSATFSSDVSPLAPSRKTSTCSRRATSSGRTIRRTAGCAVWSAGRSPRR